MLKSVIIYFTDVKPNECIVPDQNALAHHPNTKNIAPLQHETHRWPSPENNPARQPVRVKSSLSLCSRSTSAMRRIGFPQKWVDVALSRVPARAWDLNRYGMR